MGKSSKSELSWFAAGPYDSTKNVLVISLFAVLALQVLYRTSIEAYRIRMVRSSSVNVVVLFCFG
jgi:hypothetical protein